MLKIVSFKSTYLFLFLWMISVQISCGQKQPKKTQTIELGISQTKNYISLLKHKNVVVVANQTSVFTVKTTKKKVVHLVDSLISLKINVQKVFAPEHGFRGKADAGEVIKDGFDSKTGLPIISLYGKNKKPSAAELKNIDVVVFDIQDVGARFYTYISTLHYVMEACAALGISVIILDRPNPNAHYVDGPVLEMAHKSFVGMHPVPVVYGMTIGEYGQLINGEKWLKNGIQCDLKVIRLRNYNHQKKYELPVKPSPNLPNAKSINLYPSLCFFEGTNVSVGRGTAMQFQVVGSPFHRLKRHNFSFTPQPNEGAKYPKNQGKINYGYDLRNEKHQKKIHLKWLLDFYKGHQKHSKEPTFFTTFFTKLAGTKKLQTQIENGVSEEDIRKSWQKELQKFKKIRMKYLLYP